MAMVAQMINMQPANTISFEVDPIARKIAKHANQTTHDFCGTDHDSMGHDVLQVTEAMIKAIGRNAITFVGAGTPCEDFSLLRLLPPRHSGDIKAT